MNRKTPGRFGGRTALALAIPSCLLGVLFAGSLTDIPVAAVLRAGADAAGATALGLATLPRLAARLAVPWRTLSITAGIWCVLEFALLLFAAADVVGTPVDSLGGADFGTYLRQIGGGQIGVAILAGTAGIAAYSAWIHRRAEAGGADAVLVGSAVLLALRPITGHMSQQLLGSVLGAVHAVAAAAWLGVLIALTLVVRSRGVWAVALPKYSTLALPLAGTVAVTGLINGTVRLGGVEPFISTGYGRIMLAKALLLCLLLVLGWWWRRTWVRHAAAHRMDADGSLRRAIIEVICMTPVFGLAASLALTA